MATKIIRATIQIDVGPTGQSYPVDFVLSSTPFVSSARLDWIAVYGVAVTGGVPNVDYIDVSLGELTHGAIRAVSGNTAGVAGGTVTVPLTGPTTYHAYPDLLLSTPHRPVPLGTITASVFTPSRAHVVDSQVRRVVLGMTFTVHVEQFRPRLEEGPKPGLY